MDPCLAILGPTAIRIDGEWVENWGRPREHALLAALLTRPNEMVPASEVASWVWDDDEAMPQSPSAALATYVTRVRRSLERVAPDIDVRGANKAYRIVVAKDAIDYHCFRALIAQARSHARSGASQPAAELSERALSLWRSTPLTDLTSERADAWRRSVVQNEWLPANIQLIESWLSLGNFDQAIALLDELDRDHPHEIRLTALRMTALHALGRGTEATGLFLSTRHRLRDAGDDEAERYLRHQHDKLLAGAEQMQPSGQRIAFIPAPPRQLPPTINDLVGRETELTELDDVLAQAGSPPHGVVVVDGMAGVGKTTLVVHWGHRRAKLFPDGTLYANLDGYSDREPLDPSVVVDDFLIALDYSPESSTSPRHRQMTLSKLLSSRQTLIVLDNARNSDHIGSLVGLFAENFVVVASRQHLSKLQAATGARRIRVNPLRHEESRTLLARHLGTTSLDDTRTSRVIELCDGLPLIIHLVAEQIAHRSPDAVAPFVDQLDRDQLINDIGDTGDGTLNIAALFRQSYLALPPPERQLLRRLPICPGPDFSNDTAAACDGRTRHDTIKSLNVLTGAHLLEPPDAAGRYRLHDLLAEFAGHCLDTDETEIGRRDAERRVLSYYLRTALNASHLLFPSVPPAPPLTTDIEVEPTPLHDRDHAKAWFDEERNCLTAAIAMATEHQHHDYAWRIADPVATYFDRRGYQQDSRIVRHHAVTSARATGHRLAQVSNLLGLGMSYTAEGDHQQARSCLTTALDIVENEGDDRGQSAALHLFGRLEILQGNHDTALRYFHRSLDIAARTDDIEVQAWNTCRIGHILRALDQHDSAREHFHRADWLAQRIDERSARASSLTGLASIHRHHGDYATATAYCARALDLAESVPDLAVTAAVHIELAHIAIASRRGHDAIRAAQHAIQLCQQANNLADQGHAHDVLGAALHADGQPDQAIREWRIASDIYQRCGNTRLADHTREKANSGSLDIKNLPEARSTGSPTRPRSLPPTTRHGAQQ